MCVQSIFMGKIPIIGEGLNENDSKVIILHVQQALHFLMVFESPCHIF